MLNFQGVSILKKNQPTPKMYLERHVGIQASKSLPIVTVVTRFITMAWILASLAKIEFLFSFRDVWMDLSCMSICILVKSWVYRHTSGSLGLRCFFKLCKEEIPATCCSFHNTRAILSRETSRSNDLDLLFDYSDFLADCTMVNHCFVT